MQISRFLRTQMTNDYKLVMVAILHRHGDRAPILEHLYPGSVNKSNDFYPVGESNLTNVGKSQLYEVGKKLRKRYDSFLGPYFIGNEVKIITSTLERTQMSVLALCAGLFPPRDQQVWNKDLMWQPVVYTEVKKENDCIIRGPSDIYPEYKNLYNKELKSNFNMNLLKRYSQELDFIRKHAGYQKPSIRDAYYLYQSLMGEQSMGLSLPNWAKDIFPDKLEEMAVYEYDLSTLTIPLRQYAGGGLAKVITDLFTTKISNKTKQKCLIISGHESTIGYQLRLLDINDRMVPRFGSQLIWELHQKDSNYLVKIFYENFYESEPVECLSMPYEEFMNKMNPFFPSWKIII
ncbi:venom acid phosphatase Acph-1-like [Chrysoperla carnea]|uniref:venom acid phosphatase Acph-1-like n=1 Tax=Chrysoperla carnea TaxID=189513 RepID=UPI001D09628B|nr:venom acid phosphatase Acph-1-like [Chrysoperla carnea]